MCSVGDRRAARMWLIVTCALLVNCMFSAWAIQRHTSQPLALASFLGVTIGNASGASAPGAPLSDASSSLEGAYIDEVDFGLRSSSVQAMTESRGSSGGAAGKISRAIPGVRFNNKFWSIDEWTKKTGEMETPWQETAIT
ncbi:hypothetical protein BESB_003860 [Besnoitia besnoiti]|uniref:Transmembrane protein n=1 Tax=Besnoitia besnoiti TaxID=94643 RepID=A0A2A9MJ97_BESBE|nr:hypothetical protein BESB_003860 [Besnoitia besnoiti]PFH38045.1 hypothetical protein BESB_003860 [Besnoitia besnoiti]